jgi:hypothetical protein
MQVGSVDVDWLNSIVTPETVQSKYARETGIEEKMIGRFSRVNYE